MLRPRSEVPSYRLHKQSGQAVVTLTDAAGNRRDVLLGKFGSPESKIEYRRVLTEWEASGRNLPQPKGRPADLTVNELALAFWRHAEQHYRGPDGEPTSELEEYRQSLKPLKRLYGHTLGAEFGPLALKGVREAMVTGSWMTEAEKEKRRKKGHKTDCCRVTANRRVGRIKRMFKWAVENEMVPANIFHGLQAVMGLQRNRTAARETDPVQPVPDAFVDATVPFARPQVGAMVQLQRLTGMRPGEVVIIRTCDLDTTGKVWFYRPGQHKTAWRGHAKVIAIGPRAQEVLRPWLRLSLAEYLFQPREVEAQRDAERKANRKTPMTPSQARRQPKRNPKKGPGERYTVASYGQSIEYAVVAANKARACEGCKELPAGDRCGKCQAEAIPLWKPNQLRHSRATEIRREFGLDAARVVLGHRSPVITEVYAELDLNKAAEVMERLG